MQDSLIPELPESLADLTDDQLNDLLAEHKVAVEKLDKEDEEYTAGLEGDDIIAALDAAVLQVTAIKDEKVRRAEETAAFLAAKEERLAALREDDGGDDSDEGNGDEGKEGDEAETPAAQLSADEVETASDETEEQEPVKEPVKEAVVAAAAPKFRRPLPSVSDDRTPAQVANRTVLVAAGADGSRAGEELDRISLANAMIDNIKRRAKPSKHENGTEERTLIASASYNFPPERILRPNDLDGNNAKIRAIGNPFLGVEAITALLASGGLCAPLEPLYDIPDFAVMDRPVRDALPSFMAERGGISVPSVTTIGDITTAITVVEEADDALGGTFATKSCQDLDCPTWTDVAVGAISHCREYGNFNTRAWPEGIAHENNLTMAAWARTAEHRLLNRIKALSINVTQPAIGAQLNMYASLAYAITRMEAGMRYRLRLAKEVRYRALIPEWVPDALAADSAATQFTRWDAQSQMEAHLSALGISVGWYKDDVTGGTSQGFANETASAIDDFPDDVQMAFYVEGEFLHVDGGTLELGIVRDSSLNSTNDYQVFGEGFENVARIGPAQGALWATVDICPTGGMPSLVSGLTC